MEDGRIVRGSEVKGYLAAAALSSHENNGKAVKCGNEKCGWNIQYRHCID